jgi:hypothetical protein
MGVQEDFDDLYTFTTTIAPALEALRTGWKGVFVAEATTLATIDPQDEDNNDLWAAYLAGLAYTFTADNEPAGLTSEQLVIWNERANDVKYKAHRRIRQLAAKLQTNNVLAARHLVLALENLNAAKRMFIDRDIWSPEWVLFVVLGVWHGTEAGGSGAFTVPADRELFGQARTLLVNNASRCLEVFDLSRDQWPSDAAGISEYRAARGALAAFIGA